MTLHTDPDLIVSTWLAGGPATLPDPARRAILAGVQATPQRPASWSPRRWRSPAGRLPALGLLAAAVALGLLGALAVVGTSRPETLPTTAPNTSAAPAPTTSPAPAPSTIASTRFTSPLYGYSIDPGACQVTPATNPWAATGGSWDRLPSADRICSGPGWLAVASVASVAIASNEDPETWRETALPSRRNTGSCQTRGPEQDWAAWTTLRPDGLARVACGVIDAFVVTGGRAYVFSFDYIPRVGYVDREVPVPWAEFEALVSTVSLPSAAATVEPPQDARFVSPVYGYSILTLIARATPATTLWSGGGPWFEGPGVDRFDGSDGRYFAVTALDAPDGVDQAWLDVHVPRRAEDHIHPPDETYPNGHHHCEFRRPGSISSIEGGSAATWEAGAIAGRPGWLRLGCGFVDGVVFVEGRAWVLSAFTTGYTRRQLGADLDAFAAMADTIVFELPEAPPSPEFSSQFYGYAIQVPEGCEAEAALLAWVPPAAWDGPYVADRFCDKYTIASAPIPLGETVETWRSTAVPARTREAGTGSPCLLGLQASWSATEIAGRPAAIRTSCGFTDVILEADGQVYVATHGMVSHPAPAAWVTVTDFLGAIELRPEDGLGQAWYPYEIEPPIPAAEFVSSLYGYSVTYPGGWAATPAEVAWVPGRIATSKTIDALRQTGRVHGVEQFHGRSSLVPDGMTVEAWVEASLPSMRDASSGRCRGRSGPMGAGYPVVWSPRSIDDRAGIVRSACGIVEAAVVVEGRAYFFTLIGRFSYPDATEAQKQLFDEFIDTVELRPQDAPAG